VGSSERSPYGVIGHMTSPQIEENGESDSAELTEGFTSWNGVGVWLATKVRGGGNFLSRSAR
jgi:hypothetical protein